MVRPLPPLGVGRSKKRREDHSSIISRTHIILYVANQEASRAFYQAVLAQAPGLDVPGMTEFAIGQS